MADSLESRKFDRKPMFDVPLPMRKVPREQSAIAADDSGNEGALTPPKTNTMAFSLMTKKGNRQQACRASRSLFVLVTDILQTRTIEMPSDSQFAVAMKSQKEAERAEQQRIKNLVLSYDPDSSADQTGTANNLYFDYFSHTNPNLPQQNADFPNLAPTPEMIFAHDDMPQGLSVEKHGASHHQHNTSLHQSSPNNANARAPDKSGTNRSGHRARKLQLSDVDWYGPKSDPSRGHGAGQRHRDSNRTNRRSAG